MFRLFSVIILVWISNISTKIFLDSHLLDKSFQITVFVKKNLKI